ncbi:DUF4760 domain-containing protein [Stenotrophomonas indicatrix]|mgnify:CR=1 FL=1|jgi:hypothetical protein|uniref:DUF4760 domain-containing protein n=1 Tax=Stenotrophomonas indicatrix TaxID=2045451 RepID=UPI00046F62F3|nr:DUF4760 domain-containing protein [Stenotrophomonas indicatrix]
MDKVFTDLKHVPAWSWVGLLSGLVTLTLACSGAFEARPVVLLSVGALLGLTCFLAPAVFRAAKKGHKHVPTVCVWTIVWLACAVAAFLYWFFNWPALSTNEQSDRILNVVPVLTAIVFGGLGWYVHYQFSARTQRMNSSFTLVMEMMKSPEYLARNALVSDHFPPTIDDIPDDYAEYFPPGSIKRIVDEAKSKATGAQVASAEVLPVQSLQKEAVITEQPNQDDQAPVVTMATLNHEDRLEKAKAIAALRYTLNFYEFMAVGVRTNDIDCDMLLATVGPIVVGRFNRAQKLVRWSRLARPNGGGQDTAFEHLEWMCRDWEPRLEEQTSQARKRMMGRHKPN